MAPRRVSGRGRNGLARHSREWRVLAGFWREKAGADRVPSLISACATANARKGNFAHYARWREGALGATPLSDAPPFCPQLKGAGGTPRTAASSSLERRHGSKIWGRGEFSCMLVCLLCVRRVGELDATSRPSRRSRPRFHCIGHAVGWNCSAKHRIGTVCAKM
jgi:hypothetical protein